LKSSAIDSIEPYTICNPIQSGTLGEEHVILPLECGDALVAQSVSTQESLEICLFSTANLSSTPKEVKVEASISPEIETAHPRSEKALLSLEKSHGFAHSLNTPQAIREVTDSPPKKKGKPKKPFNHKSSSISSDGWSTEDDSTEPPAETSVDVGEVTPSVAVPAEVARSADIEFNDYIYVEIPPEAESVVTLGSIVSHDVSSAPQAYLTDVKAPEAIEQSAENIEQCAQDQEAPVINSPKPSSSGAQATLHQSSGSADLKEPKPIPLKFQRTKPSKSPQYQIISGQVRKVTDRSSPSSPSTQISVDVPSISGTHKPVYRPSSFDVTLSRLRAHIGSEYRPRRVMQAPDAALKFIECGDMANQQIIGRLVRGAGSRTGSPHEFASSAVFFGPHRKTPDEGHSPETSLFGYGKTRLVNQPSVREEPFDPFSREMPKNLKYLQEKNRPLLDSMEIPSIKHMLGGPPLCFCRRACARFDGVVPVYVCGAFRQG
jgi:hypothetical protein